MRAFTIARNTWRQAIHLPVLHVILIASVLLLAVVAQLPRFTLVVEDDIKMLKDLAVATATLCGVLVAIFAAVNTVTVEIENWTVVTVLSKPVRRWEFVLGKFLGLVLMLLTLYVVVTVIYTLIVWWGMWTSATDYAGVQPELMRDFRRLAWSTADEMWRGMLLCMLQVVLLTAIAVACCVRAPMIISVLVFFMAFVAGHLVGGVGWPATWVVPDLEALNFSQEVGVGRVIGLRVLAWALVYTAIYSAVAMTAGLMLFRRREVI